MDEALYYFLFADTFGWTPEQVDDQSTLRIERMLTIFEVRAEVAAARRPAIAPGQVRPR
jgi:hypothetical protein